MSCRLRHAHCRELVDPHDGGRHRMQELVFGGDLVGAAEACAWPSLRLAATEQMGPLASGQRARADRIGQFRSRGSRAG